LGGRPDTADFGAAAVVQQDHVGKGDTDEAAETIFKHILVKFSTIHPSLLVAVAKDR
jgi:hypothetical protein